MKKWFHFIGIAGITTSGLAKALLDKGFKVTGSEKGFFPPSSNYLVKNNIKILPGFKKERLTDLNGSHPDIVIIQSSKGINNEELKEAQRLGLDIRSYPEILKEYCVNKNSIVVAGSYGKTTITAILVNIFNTANKNISYMFGGFDHELNDNVKLSDEQTEYSIIEGDEYLSSYKDSSSKFMHYAPKYLILTGIKWDHIDLFNTFDSYIDTFKKLIDLVPDDGLIIANGNDPILQELLKQVKAKKIFCYTDPNPNLKEDVYYYLINESKPLKVISREEKGKDLTLIPFERNILGEYNDFNILLASALSYELNFPIDKIQSGIKTFKGIKRRMEVVYEDDPGMIIDDFGSTPAKADISIDTLIKEFKGYAITVVIDPSSGSRSIDALNEFKRILKKDINVLIPQFTLLPKSYIERFNEEEFSKMLNSININNKIIYDDKLLIDELIDIFKKNRSIILFLGSHSFRGIIDNLVIELNAKKTI